MSPSVKDKFDTPPPLVLRCCMAKCTAVLVVVWGQLRNDRTGARTLADSGWILSVVEGQLPASGYETIMAPICPGCQRKPPATPRLGDQPSSAPRATLPPEVKS